MLELSETGEMHELYKKWWYEMGQCGEDLTMSKVTSHSSARSENRVNATVDVDAQSRSQHEKLTTRSADWSLLINFSPSSFVSQIIIYFQIF